MALSDFVRKGGIALIDNEDRWVNFCKAILGHEYVTQFNEPNRPLYASIKKHGFDLIIASNLYWSNKSLTEAIQSSGIPSAVFVDNPNRHNRLLAYRLGYSIYDTKRYDDSLLKTVEKLLQGK